MNAKKLVGVVLCLGAGTVSGCTAQVSSSEATDSVESAQVAPGGTFSITHDGTTMCIQAAGSWSGAGLVIGPCQGSPYGVQAFYVGTSWVNAGEIQAYGGRNLCITIQGGNYAAGQIDLEPCVAGDTYQMWAYSRGSVSPLGKPGLCLGIAGSGQASGTSVVLSTCGGIGTWTQGQQTIMPIGFPNLTIQSIYSSGGTPLCLDVSGDYIYQGGKLDTWYCQSGNQAQQFTFTQGIDGSLFIAPSANTSVCLTESNENASGDGQLSLQPCNYASASSPSTFSQEWDYAATNGFWGDYDRYQLLNIGPGPAPAVAYECVDVQSGSSAPSTPLDIAPCNYTTGFNPAQAWYVKVPGLY